MPNSKKNQNCWNCDHFQRFDETSITNNGGECRKRQQPGNRIEDQLGDDFLMTEHWPFIADGAVFWCGEWEIVNPDLTIPAFNPAPRDTDWPSDWTDFNAAEWNVKIGLNISCWNCNHFQADELENPQSDKGECRKSAPPSVTILDDTVESGTLESTKLKINGLARWCGCWEAATHVIPIIAIAD